MVLGIFEKKLALCETEIRNQSGKLYQSTEKSYHHFPREAD